MKKNISKIVAAIALSAACALTVGLTTCNNNGGDDKNQLRNTEVTFTDVNMLGGGSVMSKSIAKYTKTFTVETVPDEAYLYFAVNGECAIYIDGVNVTKSGDITAVSVGDNVYSRIDVKGKMTAGEHTVAIATLSGKTTVKAKLYLDETTIVTDSTWEKTTHELAHDMSGKKYYVLGSSVSYGSANGGVSFAEGIKEEFGCTVEKQTVSGTTLRDLSGTLDPSSGASYVDRMTYFATDVAPDAIIVQLSTNDATQGFGTDNVLLGKMTESGIKECSLENFDIKTTVGAMEYIISYAKEHWDCEVIFYTNPKFENANYAKLVDVLYELQAKWGITVIDFYNYTGMTPLSAFELVGYMSDSIHPNHAGYNWMAEVFCDYLTKNLDIDLLNNLQ